MLIVSCGSGTDGCSEGPGPENWLASAERWVRLLSLEDARGATGTLPLAARVVPFVAGAETGVPVAETLAIHLDLIGDVDEALSRRADAFVAITDTGLEHPQVAYVVIRDADGTVTFAGDGGDWEAYFRDRLGARFDEAMMSIVGVTDADDIRAALRG